MLSKQQNNTKHKITMLARTVSGPAAKVAPLRLSSHPPRGLLDLDEFVTGCMQLHGPAKSLQADQGEQSSDVADSGKPW